MAQRKVPEHLRPAFWAFLLLLKHGTDRGKEQFDTVRDVARHIIVLPEDVSMEDYEARQIALEAAGWSL